MADPAFIFDGKWTSPSQNYRSVANDETFPWDIPYNLAGGDEPPPTVTRNDVADDGNWEATLTI